MKKYVRKALVARANQLAIKGDSLQAAKFIKAAKIKNYTLPSKVDGGSCNVEGSSGRFGQPRKFTTTKTAKVRRAFKNRRPDQSVAEYRLERGW